MRIKFENFWNGFPINDNIVSVALKMLTNIEIVSENPDIIIHQGQRQYKDNNAITISWFVESMNRIGEPDYSRCDYSFNSCNHEDKRNFRIPFWTTQLNWNNVNEYDPCRGPTLYLDINKLKQPRLKKDFLIRRLCCSVASNTGGRRISFYPKISKKINVCHGGDFLKNTNEIQKKEGNSDYLEKIDFISKFKMNLCFENDDRNGYVCEKILHAFYAGCIPIYWGPKNVSEDFNVNSFINIDDYKSDEECLDFIENLLMNNNRLIDYVEQPIFVNNEIPYHATPMALCDFLKGII